jgi:mRNA interferase RelE/StbE
LHYEIILSPEAVDDLRALKAILRSMVREAIETHLRDSPTKTSKSRIKRLRGFSRPQYRLRVDTFRVYYDVTEGTVEILAIIDKSQANEWMSRAGGTQ